MENREYFTEIRDGASSKCVPASQDSITVALITQENRLRWEKQKEKAEKQLKAIKDACKHLVIYDEPSYIFTIRHCVTCGHTDLI